MLSSVFVTLTYNFNKMQSVSKRSSNIVKKSDLYFFYVSYQFAQKFIRLKKTVTFPDMLSSILRLFALVNIRFLNAKYNLNFTEAIRPRSPSMVAS